MLRYQKVLADAISLVIGDRAVAETRMLDVLPHGVGHPPRPLAPAPLDAPEPLLLRYTFG
ncbi:hypothetical protein PO002_43060 [Cupriavidus necator]|uniref:hypothetical protein n=1 Tax=Cupriavidus necator TaxID=106590 RepID=UPI0039C2349C